ncbi:MAG TPA: hypothetical protein VFQ13_10995 [Anaerolineales bacterium]|nr:hypothetical protein [Anaerolineales bacterium]
MDQTGSVQHLDRRSQMHQWARLGAEQTTSQQSQARAEAFPTGGDQSDKSRLERRTVRVHPFEEQRFHLLQPGRQRIEDSQRDIHCFDHIGLFGNNRNRKVKK